MTIQFTFPTYVPSLTEGISKNVHHLAEALRANGDDVDLRCPSAGIGDMNSKTVYIRKGFAALDILKDGLRDPDVDVVHYHVSIPGLAAFSTLARWGTRKPRPKTLVGHFWNPWFTRKDTVPPERKRELLYHAVFNGRHVARPGLWGLDAVFVSSEFQRRQLLDLGFRKPVFVIPNGVAHDLYRPPKPGEKEEARREFGLDGADEVLLYFGHLTPWKGVIHFVNALPRALEDHPGARVAIAHTSYGDEKERIVERLRELGLEDRVTWIGVCDVPTLLRAADVGTVPMVSGVGTACHPNVLLEYMAAGVPVCASRAGSIPEVVQDGRTGFLFEPGNAAELGDRLHELLDDPSLRRRMGVAARRLAETRYDWRAIGRDVKRAYAALERGDAGSPASSPLPGRAVKE